VTVQTRSTAGCAGRTRFLRRVGKLDKARGVVERVIKDRPAAIRYAYSSGIVAP